MSGLGNNKVLFFLSCSCDFTINNLPVAFFSGTNEEAFLGTASLATLGMLGCDRILVVLGLHPALRPQTADDLFHLLFVWIGVVTV